eukprot:4793037-Karenia_brevis.AAC.1
MAGVRQGCPLSSIIFVIASDPLNKYISANMSPQSIIRTYADDTAVVLKNLFKEAPILATIFYNIGLCSNL